MFIDVAKHCKSNLDVLDRLLVLSARFDDGQCVKSPPWSIRRRVILLCSVLKGVHELIMNLVESYSSTVLNLHHQMEKPKRGNSQ